MGSSLVMDLEDHITTTTKEKKTNSFMSVRQKVSFYDQFFDLSGPLQILSRIDGSKDVCNSYKCKD